MNGLIGLGVAVKTATGWILKYANPSILVEVDSFFNILKRVPSVLMETNNWVDFWGWQGTGSYRFEKRHCWVSHIVGKKGAISELGQYSFVFQIS